MHKPNPFPTALFFFFSVSYNRLDVFAAVADKDDGVEILPKVHLRSHWSFKPLAVRMYEPLNQVGIVAVLHLEKNT